MAVRTCLLVALSFATFEAAFAASLVCNGGGGLRVKEVARYFTGDVEQPVEIFDFTPKLGRAYFVGGTEEVHILSTAAKVTQLNKYKSFSVGAGKRATSVAVKNNRVAVAVANGTHPWAAGEVHVYDLEGRLKAKVAVNSLPDMLIWSQGGKKIYVAIEGEPESQNDESSGSDPLKGANPPGEFAIISLSYTARGQMALSAKSLSFLDYFAALPRCVYASLLEAGMRIDPRLDQSQAGLDVEPEYIALDQDGAFAYVSLQEANSIAVIDLKAEAIKEVWPLGWKDWSNTSLDASDKGDSINMRTWPNLYSWYQPDTIAVATIGGKQYIFTANEGDTKEEYLRVKEDAFVLDPGAFPAQLDVKADTNLGRLNADPMFGFKADCGYNANESFEAQTCPRDKIIFTGGRSFSILDAASGKMVYDSGDIMELVVSEEAPTIFNTGNSKNTFRTRSDNKGPEPEAIAVKKIGNRYYAAVALERQGGLMFFDVTTPAQATYVGYLSDRTNATLGAEAADLAPLGISLGPECVRFLPGNRLAVGNEMSGHLVVYTVQAC